MKYYYEYYDGEEWIAVEEFAFNTAEEAELSAMQDGFQFARVKSFQP